MLFSGGRQRFSITLSPMVKRKRTLGVDRVPSSGQRPANPSDATVRTIPLVFPENECNGAVPETSYGSDNDQTDDREVGPNDDTADCKEKKTNRLSHDALSDDSWYIEFLDKKICIKCNEGGEVLVCNENGCPVVLHARCLCCEPEFDDRGNFYCPYCWFKQAVAKVQELRRKAVKAKEALSSFLDKIVTTGNRLSKKESVAGDESLNVCNSHSNDGVNNQTFQVHGEEKRETDTAAATADPNRIAVEGEAHANPSVVNTIDSRHYRGQKTPVPFEPVLDSRNREKFDTHNISETHETGFFEGGERIEPEVLRQNDEDIQKTMGKDVLKALPLSVYHLGEYADGQALDIAFAKGTQESVAISAENKDRMNNREKGERALPKELKVSATASSVSETNDSDSEALSVQKNHFKRKARKTAYSEKVDSVRKTLSQKSNSRGKNALIQNEEATNCKTLGQPQGSSKQVKDLHFLNSRKRLRWTAEEENMLKKGVEMFAKENQNTPWRKILEYGSNVFDSTRSPVDLKDKWRNIVAKEGGK